MTSSLQATPRPAHREVLNKLMRQEAESLAPDGWILARGCQDWSWGWCAPTPKNSRRTQWCDQ